MKENKNRKNKQPSEFKKENNLIREVRSFLKEGGNINAKDEDGQTYLHNAAENGQLRLLEFLLKKQS